MRELAVRLRSEPAPVQVAVVLLLCGATIHASTTKNSVNSAPLPGSNAVFAITLPGCRHRNDAGWVEAEIVRKTTAGDQHVALVGMLPDTEAIDRYGNAETMPHQPVLSWDGTGQKDVELAEYNETFTQGRQPFNLAEPA